MPPPVFLRLLPAEFSVPRTFYRVTHILRCFNLLGQYPVDHSERLIFPLLRSAPITLNAFLLECFLALYNARAHGRAAQRRVPVQRIVIKRDIS